MNIVINGNEMELDNDVTNISMLLEHLKLAEKQLIVEHNKNIIQKGRYQHISVENGDTLEIVHFVGGG